jgi:hypothetical protein
MRRGGFHFFPLGDLLGRYEDAADLALALRPRANLLFDPLDRSGSADERIAVRALDRTGETSLMHSLPCVGDFREHLVMASPDWRFQ